MAYRDGKAFSNLKGVHLKTSGSGSGAVSFTSQTSAPTDDSDERWLYVKSDSLTYWNGTSETTLGGATSGGNDTLNTAYDNGNQITVDAGAVTLNGSHATNVLLDLNYTGSGTGNMIDIQNDTTGTAGYDIIGTDDTWSLTSTGILVATAINIADDNDITFGTDSDITIEYDEDGNDELLITGATGINGNVNLRSTSTFTQAGSAGSTVHTITAGDMVMSDGSLAITDADNATTFTVTNATATTGNVAVITGDAVTEGSLLYLDNGGDSLTTGLFINCNDDGAAKFSVGTTGITTIAGTAGSDSFTLTAGDAVLSDGSLSITDADNATSLAVTNGSCTTGTAILATLDGLANGIGVRIDADGGCGATGAYFDAYNGSASVFSVGENGAVTIAGSAGGTDAFTITAGDLLLNDSDQNIIESENGTTTTLLIDNKAGVIASDSAVLSLDAGGAVASGGNILRIAPTGTPNAGAIGIEFVGAGKLLTALSIDADPTATDVVVINGGGALTDGNAILSVQNDGNLAAGGIDLEIVVGGTPNADARAFEISGSGKDCRGMYVDVDSATNDAITFNLDGALGAGKDGVLIDLGGAISATSSALAVKLTGSATAGAIVTEVIPVADTIGVKIDGGGIDTYEALLVDADSTTNDIVKINSDGVLAADKGALQIVTTGNIAAGGTAMRFDITGTPNADARVLEFDLASVTDTNEPYAIFIDAGGKKVRALHIDGDPVTNDLAYFHTDAVIADNKAVMSLHSAGAMAAGSSILRLAQAGTPAAATSYTFEIDNSGGTLSSNPVCVRINHGSSTGSAIQATGSGASAPMLDLLNTNTGATGVVVQTTHTSTGSAANGDAVMVMKNFGLDAGDASTEYTRLEAEIMTATAGQEDGKWVFSAAADDSTMTQMLTIAPRPSTANGELAVGSGAATGYVTSSGAYDLVIDTNSGTNTGNITLTDGANGDITLTCNGTGDVVMGSPLVVESSVGVTADVGSSQGDGAFTETFLEIATCANAGDAVTLPAAEAGKVIIVTNRGANSADIFPASGDNINEAGADTQVACAADASRMFVGIDGTHWESFILARA